MDAFKCDRCGEYGPAVEFESVEELVGSFDE